MQNFSLSKAIRERFEAVENELGYSEHILKIDCDKLDTWEFRDRKAFELGDIDDLAASIKHAGQCHPIIIVRPSEVFRPKSNPLAQYIVISGYRRWMACKKYGIDILSIERTLSFEQAVAILASENKKEAVSEYSKGMFYYSLLGTGKISKDELSKRINISPLLLDSYLAFSQVPQEIWDAMGDLSRVSTKTASVIRDLARQGSVYVDALIHIAKKIAHGYGEKRIHEELRILIDKKSDKNSDEHDINHQLKFNGKVVMSLKHGKIKLDKSLMSDSHYEELVSKIEKDVTNFALHYLNDRRS